MSCQHKNFNFFIGTKFKTRMFSAVKNMLKEKKISILWLRYAECVWIVKYRTTQCPSFSEAMTMTATTSSPTFLCSFHSPKPLLLPKSSALYHPRWLMPKPVHHNAFSSTTNWFSSAKPLVPKENRSGSRTHLCSAGRRKPTPLATSSAAEEGDDDNLRRVLQIALWVAEGVYILWLFLLPYAPVSTHFCGVAVCCCYLSVCWVCSVLSSIN